MKRSDWFLIMLGFELGVGVLGLFMGVEWYATLIVVAVSVWLYQQFVTIRREELKEGKS